MLHDLLSSSSAAEPCEIEGYKALSLGESPLACKDKACQEISESAAPTAYRSPEPRYPEPRYPVLALMAPSPNRVNMDHALCSPSAAQLIALLVSLCSTGLWKLGSCFERLLDVRTHDSAHYNPKYFNRDGAICVAYGIASKVLAATLETTGIQYLKYTLRVGVNSKDSDDVPHDGYNFSNLAALYLVPVVARITTQAQFFQEHVSYYMERTHGTSTKEERKLAKRAAKLAELMEVIPARLLSEAFQPWRSQKMLNGLEKTYGCKQSGGYIHEELRMPRSLRSHQPMMTSVA